MDKHLILIGGPTAVGKTSVAIEIARNYDTVILSIDSRQFYRELEIGTAKPSSEELTQARHYFINSHSIESEYSAGEYAREARDLLDSLFLEKDIVVATGGSGLYIKALIEGLDEMPEIDPTTREAINERFNESGLQPLLLELKEKDPDYFETVDQSNPRRIIRALEVIESSGKPYSAWRNSNVKSDSFPYGLLKIGLEMDRQKLYDRIELRMDRMIGEGLLDEVKSLVKYRDHAALQTVGYTEIFRYLDGDYDWEECKRLLNRNSRRYAKRQMTWFKNQEKMTWFNPSDLEAIKGYLRQSLGY